MAIILIEKIKRIPKRITAFSSPKIFGIGANKTGTTSLKIAMKNLGFLVGTQRTAENLIEDWAKRDFERIIKYCRFSTFFQDVPFSLPFTYQALDIAYPKSKFILTIRDNPEQWYNSLTKFHAKKWGKDGRIPTKKDLENTTDYYKGKTWDIKKIIFNSPDDDPYNKECLVNYYNWHNHSVMEYFKHRPTDLLVLNVSKENAYKELCDFLNIKTDINDFPWENKTSNITK